MKNMIYALTRQQVREKANDVTRRMDWLRLKHGDWAHRVMRCMGFRTEERIEKVDEPVITVSMRSKLQRLITGAPDYGCEECKCEWFPNLYVIYGIT